jgi:hypothetical protein
MVEEKHELYLVYEAGINPDELASQVGAALAQEGAVMDYQPRSHLLKRINTIIVEWQGRSEGIEEKLKGMPHVKEVSRPSRISIPENPYST